MSEMRIGSLCSGYGGLDMAVQRRVLGAEPSWVADNNPHASKVLAARYPAVPNLGDITTTDWAAVEPVDILTAGFPCQDVSTAGLRKGLRDGTRTGIWSHVAESIDVLRPQLVLLENVRGLLSAGADSDVEPCPWCLGDSGSQHALRALGAVLGDLSDIGYVGRYRLVSAADAGAPHRRERVFILAWPDANPGGERLRELTGGSLAEEARPVAGDILEGHRGARADSLGRPADDADREPWRERGGSASGQAEGGRARADAGGSGGAPVADTDSAGREGAESAGRQLMPARGDTWGRYAGAITRWETVLGRPAPRPTEPGRSGERLSPGFVEFMMGLPGGWVTGVPGLSRTAQLLVLGGGVVPQQGELALRLLLSPLSGTLVDVGRIEGDEGNMMSTVASSPAEMRAALAKKNPAVSMWTRDMISAEWEQYLRNQAAAYTEYNSR